MIILFIIFFRYSAKVTQHGKYHLFPPFSPSKDNHLSCETTIEEIRSDSKPPPSNAFGIFLNFRGYPAAFNVEEQIKKDTKDIQNPLKLNYSEFMHSPNYPVVINLMNQTFKYEITVACKHGMSGMDQRDQVRQYYLIAFVVLLIPMYVAAILTARRKKLRALCTLIASFYYLSIFFRYLAIFMSKASTDIDKKYPNTHNFILTADAFSSFSRIFAWSSLLSFCTHPVFVEPDFEVKNFLFFVFFLIMIYEIVDVLFYIDLFPYLEEESISKKYFGWLSSSYSNLEKLYWSMYAILLIELLYVSIKILRFLPKRKSKFIKRAIKMTMWLIVISSNVFYICGRLDIFFAMQNGGISMMTNLISDVTDFLLTSLCMGVVYHFEKCKKIYIEMLKKRRAKRNQREKNQKNDNEDDERDALNPEPLNDSTKRYTDMNEPLLMNSTNLNANNNNLA